MNTFCLCHNDIDGTITRIWCFLRAIQPETES